MAKVKISENDIQRQIIDWVRWAAPSVKIIAIPNASRRTTGGRPTNAVPGLTPGAPDLLVIMPAGEVLWMEVKSAIGRVSPARLEFHQHLHVLGHTCAVVRSIEDVRLAFQHVKIPIREA